MVNTEQTQPSAPNPITQGWMRIARTFEYIATHDNLTGLYNKTAWKQDVAERIEDGDPFGVMFMDLNAFKRINDVFGHDKGDEVLQEFGSFLRSRFHRATDVITHERLIIGHDTDNTKDTTSSTTLSRWAGDEFGVTFSLSDNERRGTNPTTGQPLTVAERAEQESNYLQKAIAEFVENQPDEIKKLGFNVSIGTAYWDPSNPVSADALFKIVDQKMFVHKQALKAEAVRALPLRKRTALWLGRKLMSYGGEVPR